MNEDEIVSQVNEFVAPYGLSAQIFAGIKRVGVKGDARVYQPVINLIGQFPGWDTLAELSTRITNKFDVSGVTFQVSSKVEEK